MTLEKMIMTIKAKGELKVKNRPMNTLFQAWFNSRYSITRGAGSFNYQDLECAFYLGYLLKVKKEMSVK